MIIYAGFDRADCPDLATMAQLRRTTNLVWTGYYLHAPSQAASTWQGKRAALVALGFGLAPIYVGQQIVGPGSHNFGSNEASIDGGQAVSDMKTEGFPTGSWVYLDLESWPFPITYIEEWASAVEDKGYRAGVYCSFAFANTVSTRLPKARLWVYHVPSVAAHSVAGVTFPSPDPASSGFPGAVIWQHQDEARLTDFNDFACDLDSSIYDDPSAPDDKVSVTVDAPLPASPNWPPYGTSDWVKTLQCALNKAGALPALVIDGDMGDLTIKALETAIAHT
jgi:hypothetical protein